MSLNRPHRGQKQLPRAPIVDGQLHPGNVDEDLRWLANEINKTVDGVEDVVKFKDIEDDYTLEFEDAEKYLHLFNSVACPPKVLTIPHSSSVPFRVGRTFIPIEQMDIGQFQIVGADERVTVHYADGFDCTRGQYSAAVLILKGQISHEIESVVEIEDVWSVIGDLALAEEEESV